MEALTLNLTEVVKRQNSKSKKGFNQVPASLSFQPYPQETYWSMHVCMCVRVYVCVHMYVCAHVCVHVCTCTCMCVQTCVCERERGEVGEESQGEGCDLGMFEGCGVLWGVGEVEVPCERMCVCGKVMGWVPGES